MSVPGEVPAPETAPDSPMDALARNIYETLEKLFSTRVEALESSLEGASGEFSQLKAENQALAQRLVEVEARLGAVSVSAGKRPKVHAPDPYDGKDKEKAEQFIQQITVAAKFEHFDNDEQKVLWAQTYLTGSAHSWAALITFGQGAVDSRLREDWEAWVAAFRETFCSRDAAKDAISKLGVLSQGLKSITDYTTEFNQLVAKLPLSEQTGQYINSRYWDGLSLMSKQHLANTDFTTAAEAQAILLRRESRLADITQQLRRSGGGSTFTHAVRSSSSLPTAATPTQRAAVSSAAVPHAQGHTSKAPVSAPPAPSRDPNAMDVDGARQRRGALTCFRCGGVGHRQFQCTSDVMAQLKAGMIEEIARSLAAANIKPAETAPSPPEPGFV